MKYKLSRLALLIMMVVSLNLTGFKFAYSQGAYLLDTVKAGRFDNGTMWTFDHPPKQYFQETYGFTASDEWLNHVRMSALRFANYCSASFISADGLVMTNHHCGRESVSKVQKPDEDLHLTGFVAAKLEDERPVEGLYVDQLVSIADVTKDIQSVIDAGKTDEEKIKNRDDKIKELEADYSKQTGLICKVTTLYNGGEYLMYEYKRYNDVRLVFAPEDQMGFFGGDADNFTFPRYNFDCTFFRVYGDDGKPLKTDNYFKWSEKGSDPGELVFVVGNPGRTDRLKTVRQLEFDRDFSYPTTLKFLHKIIDSLKTRVAENPELNRELSNQIFGIENSRKVYEGTLKGLQDPILMAKRKDFEKKFKNAVMSNADLKSKYGNTWDEITSIVNEKAKLVNELLALDTNTAAGKEKAHNLNSQIKQSVTSERSKTQLLGRAIFEVYGFTIPPDATFTLRISDGVVKGYDYNGTTAPVKTTFYGYYDRYFSFDKQNPWDLPERWKTPPEGFDLSVPVNFISTADIIGGNSGSPIINQKAEIVGLAFDGNIESLPSRFIFTTEANRCLGVDSRGMYEAIKTVYKFPRLADEMKNGMMSK